MILVLTSSMVTLLALGQRYHCPGICIKKIYRSKIELCRATSKQSTVRTDSRASGVNRLHVINFMARMMYTYFCITHGLKTMTAFKKVTWWRHDMGIFNDITGLCYEIPPVVLLPERPAMGLLPDTQNCGCACAGNARNVFPVFAGKRSRHASRHVRDARAVMHAGIAN